MVANWHEATWIGDNQTIWPVRSNKMLLLS